MPTTTIYATKDASALDSNDGWNGWDDHHPVGSLGSNIYRSFVYFPISFSGMTEITSAFLWLRAHRAASGNHVLGAASGNDRSLRVGRMIKDWGEGTNRGEGVWSASETWGWNNRATEWTTTNAATKSFTGYVHGDWYDIPITAIVRDWKNGEPNYGLIMMILTNPDDDSNALEFYARDAGSGYKPYIEITYTSNAAPNAPTGLTPTGDALVNSLSPALAGNQSDPDAGDFITSFQILLYEDNGTTLKWDSGSIHHEFADSVFSHSYSGPALTGNTYYKWKARTKDSAGNWGAYSALQRFKVNTPPHVPELSLTEAPQSDILTLTPTINVMHVDIDPGDSKMYGYRVRLYDVNSTQLWDSGDVDTSGSPATTKSFVYSGPALSWGTSYRLRARTKDINGVWGSWSPNTFVFTTHATAVPTSLAPSNETITNLVPTFTGSRGSTNDTITSYQIVLYADDGVTQIWDSGTLTTDIVSGASFSKAYTGAALALGTSYKWKARVTASIGGTSAYSALQTFTTPADASVPSLSMTPVTNGKVTSLTPTFQGSRSAAFTNYQIELYPSTATSSNLGTPIWDSGNLSQASATSFSKVYNGGTALQWGTTYKWRARVGAPTLGTYTGLQTFSTEEAGTPTLTAPANNAWITPVSTAFTGSRSGSDSITARQVQIYADDGVTLIYDSTMESQGAATTFSETVDLSTFTTGRTYLWRARYTKSTGPTGPYSAFFSFRLNGAPQISTELFPTPGYTHGGSLFPTFKAQFVDPDETSNGDTPTSWEIEIRNNATDALIQTKTLTTGLNNGLNTYVWGTNTGGADTGLAYGTVYKWRTRFTDSKSVVGAWSSYQTFSLAQPPTVTGLVPSNGSNVSTTRPTVSWTYTDPGGSAQSRYTVSIVRVLNSTQVYRTSVASSATSLQIPAGYLQRNGEDYTVTVSVENAGGVQSAETTNTFSLQLAAPPAIEGLSATVMEDQSHILLEWDASNLTTSFVTYVVYRRAVADTEWTAIGTVKPESTTYFKDYYAGNGLDYEYRVTVVKLIANEPDLESPDSDIVSTTLDSDVWMVIGKDRSDEHIFELFVSSESHTRPVQQESFEPLGSNRKAVVRGFVLGHEGSLEVNIDEADTYSGRRRIEYLLYYAGPHILKSPFGDVYDVTFGSPDFQYVGGGHLNVTLTWVEVGATNNPGLSPDEFLSRLGAE